MVRVWEVNLTLHSHALMHPVGQPWPHEVLDLGLPGLGAWVLPLPAQAPDWRRLMAWAPQCLPCPSDNFIFQDLLCQRQKLCGKDEEDGEFSLSLCSALVGRWGCPAEGQLRWTGGERAGGNRTQFPRVYIPV